MRHPKLLERIEDYKKAFDIVAGEAWDAYEQAHMDILCIVEDDPIVKKRIHDSLAEAMERNEAMYERYSAYSRRCAAIIKRLKRPDVPGNASGDDSP